MNSCEKRNNIRLIVFVVFVNLVMGIIDYVYSQDSVLVQIAQTVEWNTFLGSGDDDRCYDIAVDGTDVFISGRCSATWGDPKRPFSGSLGCHR